MLTFHEFIQVGSFKLEKATSARIQVGSFKLEETTNARIVIGSRAKLQALQLYYPLQG